MTPSHYRMLFFQRTYPSANMVVVPGPRPLLIDTGFGSDIAATERLLRDADLPPERLALIVNTHYHSDHVGGNSALQQRYGLPIAAHRWDAALINQRDREACAADWLDQPIEPYQVDIALADGAHLDTGALTLQVLHMPGHTLGQIALYAPETGELACGDALHGDDVAWINPFREGAGALERALESLDRLASLPLRRAYSGHGPAIEQPQAALDRCRRRYEQWIREPQKIAWHACKRILTYALMLRPPLTEAEVRDYALSCPWFYDYSRHVFELDPQEFFAPLLAELVRAGALRVQDGRMIVQPAHHRPPPGWIDTPTRPKDWPPVEG